MPELLLPRLVIAGLSGSAGKTLVSLGIIRALRAQGLKVAVFKKGPDFIDTAWLAAAAGGKAANLDTFLADPNDSVRSLQKAASADIAVVEGNRGLFDGFDARGTHSTAELAKLLGAPVILVLDATKATRTIAAMVLGCQTLDPEVKIAGIILNRVGTDRQQRLIEDAVASTTQVPVLGALPRLEVDHLPSRHLGLVMPGERPECEALLNALGDIVNRHVNLRSLRHLSAQAAHLRVPEEPSPPTALEGTLVWPRAVMRTPRKRVRIGVLQDAAFGFYYSENLEALKAAGAVLVPISPLNDQALPAIDALYAGGGYPEQFAAQLAANLQFRTELAGRILEGMPVWAECGGLMYLGRAIERDGRTFPMIGALPISTVHTERTQAHGYVESRVDVENPYLAVGTLVRGHEFHNSHLVAHSSSLQTALSVSRGKGLLSARDGLICGRIFASYMHIFAPGVPQWAPSFLRVARAAQAELKARAVKGEPYGKHHSWNNEHRDRRGWVHPGTR